MTKNRRETGYEKENHAESSGAKNRQRLKKG
jgi:hypothetical protein